MRYVDVWEGRGAALDHSPDGRNQGRVGSREEALHSTPDGLRLGAQEGPSEPLLGTGAGAGGAEALLTVSAGRWTKGGGTEAHLSGYPRNIYIWVCMDRFIVHASRQSRVA